MASLVLSTLLARGLLTAGPKLRPTSVTTRLLSMSGAPPSVGTLYDLPVSNNGARCRMVLYYKGVPDAEVAIRSPAELGGLKSEAYLAANPQGKMPLLVLAQPPSLAIPESDTICRFLCSRYASQGPSLIPADALDAAKSDRVCRLHDIYLATVQPAMYKVAGSGGSQTFPPFGGFGSREAALSEIVRQLAVLEDYADADGPYLAGPEPTLADCTIWPSAIFWAHMLPKFESVDPSTLFGPRVARWMAHMRSADEVGARVHGEISGALEGWDKNERWAPILGAGARDTAGPTLFDSILSGVSRALAGPPPPSAHAPSLPLRTPPLPPIPPSARWLPGRSVP
jgi:glutathione S-transferase